MDPIYKKSEAVHSEKKLDVEKGGGMAVWRTLRRNTFMFFENIFSDLFGFFSAVGSTVLFCFNVAWGGRRARETWQVFFGQLWRFIVRPSWVIGTAGFAVGSVFAFQLCKILSGFHAEAQLPIFLALPMSREFAPVFSAWLFSGMLGSSITAEVGLMRASEQMLSLELMGVDPFRRVFMPRFYAAVIALPLLTFWFLFMALVGAVISSMRTLGLEPMGFLSCLFEEIFWRTELRSVMAKSLSFALLISWSALWFGARAYPTAEGVSRSTTQGVVVSFIGVLLLDFVWNLVDYAGEMA